MIKAVLFDIGGVMTESMARALSELSRLTGATPRDLAELIFGGYGDRSDNPWHRVERGELAMAAFVEQTRAAHGDRVGALEAEIMIEVFGSLRVHPEMLDAVRAVRRRGLRTAVITNNARELADIWRASVSADELFDLVVDSSEIGLRKPDPAIFRYALDRLGIAAEEAVLLDDMAVNCDAAELLGIRPLLVGADPVAVAAQLDALLSDESSAA